MKRNRLVFAKCLLSLGLFLITGMPCLWLRRVFWPSQINGLAWLLAGLSFALLWKDTRCLKSLKKDWLSWIVSTILITLAILRPGFLPPYHFKMYDLFYLAVAASFLFHPSGIKELLVYSSWLILPLSLAELYGFLPSSSASLILAGLGLVSALFLTGLEPFGLKRPFGLKGPSRPKADGPMASTERRILPTCYLLLAVLAGALSFLMMNFSKGLLKNGRIVFDIGHGTTESPQLDYNTNLQASAAFGHGKLGELLETCQFHVDYIRDITPASLSESSILVLIMPSLPYIREEIRAIREFVFKGGGLLAIGDHSDLSNVLFSLNPVIEQFGVRLRFDTVWLQANDRENLCYRHHPALFDLEEVHFSVGASLEVEPPARPVVMSRYATFSDLGDPNNEARGYLGNAKPDPGERIHDLCLMAESHYGKGRILVMGDSAYFQNASLYQNRAFACRLFDWLNHCRREFPRRNILLVTLAILVLMVSMFLVYRGVSCFSLLLTFSLSALLMLWLAGISNLRRFPKPPPPDRTILVDMAHQNEYSFYWMTRENTDTGLDGLISQIVRMGFYPVTKAKGRLTREVMKGHRACFVICPNVPFSEGEIEALARFVEEGGGLLLVDGPRKWAAGRTLWERFNLLKDRYPFSARRPILSPLGLPIRLAYGNFGATVIPHPVTSGIPHLRLVNPCQVSGGQPIAFIDDRPVVNFKDFGRGRIIAVGDDRFLANYMTEFENQVIDPVKIRLIWNIIGYLTQAETRTHAETR